MPLISSLNITNWNNLIENCIENLNQNFPHMNLNRNIVSENFKEMKRFAEQKERILESVWLEKWIRIMIRPFGEEVISLTDLDAFLQKEHKRIVFIIDGLEDLLMNVQSDENNNWKFAIRSVCQYLINDISNLNYGNIGMIVFVRKDMIEDAIETNMEQFRNQHYRYELNWSQKEALRLILWLTSRACPALAGGINILTAAREVLVEKLSRLWGEKLGQPGSKEAYSDRWVLAALSDFNGQLQARDVVRFLQFATENYQSAKQVYPDRLIMPNEIRRAIQPCSEQKMKEIESEMKEIYAILEKLDRMPQEEKTLPMTLDKIVLTGEEIARLETQGYLKILGKKYYLPEIIRLALGFKYEKGVRPKVLSLLVK